MHMYVVTCKTFSCTSYKQHSMIAIADRSESCGRPYGIVYIELFQAASATERRVATSRSRNPFGFSTLIYDRLRTIY